MKSIRISDPHLECQRKHCDSTEAVLVLPEFEDEILIDSVCCGCGTYTQLTLEDFDIYQKDLIDIPSPDKV